MGSLEPDSLTSATYSETVVDAAGHRGVVQPVAAATPVAERMIIAQPAVQNREVTSYRRRFAFDSFDSFVVGLVGLALTVFGLVAATRAGFDGPMTDPVIEVLGFTHTVTLGLIEAALGVCLLLCAATTSRAASIFFGVVLGIGAFVAAVQVESFDKSLAIESSLAWLLVVAALIVVAASVLVPRMVTTTAHVESF